MIKSPSFSRSASSTTMTILPLRKSSTTASMESNAFFIFREEFNRPPRARRFLGACFGLISRGRFVRRRPLTFVGQHRRRQRKGRHHQTNDHFFHSCTWFCCTLPYQPARACQRFIFL